jgi:hypothetical protein
VCRSQHAIRWRKPPRPIGDWLGNTCWGGWSCRYVATGYVVNSSSRSSRASRVGSEFLQALDVRFASRERAFLFHIEIGTGIIPGGGGLDRLPRLIGRARALEAIIGCEDFDADTAERYGWVNRSIPDAELDAFVERFATRVATFDRRLIAVAKEIINQRAGLAQPADLVSSQKKFFETATWHESQARLASLMQRGLQQVELRAHYSGEQRQWWGDRLVQCSDPLGPDRVRRRPATS